MLVSVVALLALPGRAQQDVPDAPQPQKKAEPAKPKPAPPAETPAPPPTAKGADDNSFPEAVSREAAGKAAEQNHDDSGDGAKSSSKPATVDKPAKDGNAFPEDVSREAAKAAGNDPATPTVPKGNLPPGVSSSQSQGSLSPDGSPVKHDPVLAQKDTEVGNFYLKNGNVQGALQRFKDASAADPTNVAAIFGAAEAQRLLGKSDEAARSYQMYLDIVPNGPKSKESIKALKSLQAKK
jgi:tetratricopeptide (TPR) repeat protein